MNTKKAIFAGGCFWCTEAIFQNLKGVLSVVSGYIGGTEPFPTYSKVSTGLTGYNEAIEIEFNPLEISFKELVYVFFYTHNPTTLNQQGVDSGTQYKSAIYYFSEEQKRIVEEVQTELEHENIFESKIVTELNPVMQFYPAEKYHQNYFNENPTKSYCEIVIFPKIEKLKAKFSHLLKDDRTV